MANPEHLAILKQGFRAWNRWREEYRKDPLDLSGAELSTANLYGADLHEVNLTGAKLSLASLSDADLSDTNLSGANLQSANLSGADLRGANLRGAQLTAADMHDSYLDNADFSNAHMHLTDVVDVDLSNAKGLEAVVHDGPSSIGIDTLYKSQGRIPDKFLRGAGVPEDVIEHLLPLIRNAGQPIQWYSCFISYSTIDKVFAGRLHRDLQDKSVRCWLFTEDAKWGETVWGEIDRGIKLYDKLVVVCSEHSLQSPAVLREIERGLQREDREKKNVLFPIRIDDYIFDKWEHERKADVVKKVVGDFRQWKDHDAYQESFARLLKDLQATDSKKA
jgi:hypothetical protein